MESESLEDIVGDEAVCVVEDDSCSFFSIEIVRTVSEVCCEVFSEF